MRLLGIGWLLVTVSLVGCGGDDDGGGGGGNSSGADTSCHSYCDADQAAACGLYASADECYDFECGFVGAPQACLAAVEAYYDCLTASPDICSAAACPNESNAYFTACS
jgi:hypothetical protein